jgi:flagellar hook-length control protein FliK
MTSSSVVTGSSTVQPGSATGKTKSASRDEEEVAVPPEFLAFADLFSQLTGDEAAAAAQAPVIPQQTAAPPPAAGGSKEETSALQMEATHSQWFGTDADTLAEPVLRRKPPLLIRDPAVPLDGQPQANPGAEAPPMPPALVAELALAKQQQAAAQVAAQVQAAAVQAGQPGASPEEGTALEAHAELPRGDLLRFQAAMMRPDRSTNPGLGGQQANARSASADAGQAGGQSASKVQASLSALQAALSERSLFGEAVEAFGDQPGGAAQAMKDAGITSVRQETYFAPASQSPGQQIFQRVLSELQMEGARPIEPSANVMEQTRPPVRVLSIQLEPPHLGPMTIRLSMHDEALRLQLETPNPETARMIQNERDGLSNLLRSAGYAVDNVQVQMAAATDRGGGQSSQQGFGQAMGQQPGWREPQSEQRGGGERGWRGQPEQDEPGGRGQDRGSSQGQPNRTRGVYL